MFGRITFKTQVEQVHLTIHFVDSSSIDAENVERHPPTLHTATLSWQAGDSVPSVLEKLDVLLAAPVLVQELARLSLVVGDSGEVDVAAVGGIVRAARYGRRSASAAATATAGSDTAYVRAALNVHRERLVPWSVDVAGAGSATESATVLAVLDSPGLAGLGWLTWRGPGVAALLDDAAALARLAGGLRGLDLRGAGLGSLPSSISTLRALRELDVGANALRALPPTLGALDALRALRADGNGISLLPGELARCRKLRVLDLEGNRLTHVPLAFDALRALRELRLLGNPLEVLPEIRPCTALEFLSVANLKVWAADGETGLRVELLPVTGQGYGLWGGGSRAVADRLRPIFELMLRRSTGHHPLLSGALRHLAASEHQHRVQMTSQEGALQQLTLMALADDAVVARDACTTLGLLAGDSPALAAKVAADCDLSPVLGLFAEDAAPMLVRVAALRTLGSLALACPQAGASVAKAAGSWDTLTTLCLVAARARDEDDRRDDAVAGVSSAENDIEDDHADDGTPSSDEHMAVAAAALETVGNLCFDGGARAALRRRPALVAAIDTLAAAPRATRRDAAAQPLPEFDGSKKAPASSTSLPFPAPTEAMGEKKGARQARAVRAAAVRVLAILGENAAVHAAAGRPSMQGRGVRVLAMDGGGMKGMAAVRMLRELESRTGQRIHELFDLVVGTSTGGLLACALALRGFSLDECEAMYKVLGAKVFSRAAPEEGESGWVDSFVRSFHSRTQHVRAVVVGFMHDTAMYEKLLRQYCDLTADPDVLGPTMIDTAPLNRPRVALVSTMSSYAPALPFVFRNYEFAPDQQAMQQQVLLHQGSSRHEIWQAARASSAATYYLDGFECQGDRFQDGALTVNNPALLAVQEAQLLWPGTPLEVLVSVGTGAVPSVPRPSAVSAFVETGSILIESATDVDRVAEAMAAMAHLIPGLQYFRFQPMDARCQMGLDEIRPEEWAKLEAATDEYIASAAGQLSAASHALLKGMPPPSTGSLGEPAPIPPSAGNPMRWLRMPPGSRLAVLRCEGGRGSGGEGVGAQPTSGGGEGAGAQPCASGHVPVPFGERVVTLDATQLARECSDAGAGLGRVVNGVRTLSAHLPSLAGPGTAGEEDGWALGGSKSLQSARSPERKAGNVAAGQPVADPGSSVRAGDAGTGGGLATYFSSWFSPSKAPAEATQPPVAESSEQEALPRKRARPSRTPAAAAADAATLGQALSRALERQESAIGAVCLDLPCTSDGNLILGYRHEMHAVLANSPVEAQWEALAGRSLEACLTAGGVVSLRGGEEQLCVLSRHTHWAGAAATSVWLLRHSVPDMLAPPESLAQCPALAGCVVALPAGLPWAWVDALICSGRAGAVVCAAGVETSMHDVGASTSTEQDPADKPASGDPPTLNWEGFWQAMLAGQPLSTALKAGTGLRCHYLDTQGSIATLE